MPAAQDVELLVPNAGLALGVAPIQEIDLEDVQAMLETNGQSGAGSDIERTNNTGAWRLSAAHDMICTSCHRRGWKLVSTGHAPTAWPLLPAVTSVVTLLRAFTPGMVQRNRGHIIFVGRSVGAVVDWAGHA